MTILDQIAENASRRPEQIMFHVEQYGASEGLPASLTWQALEEESGRLAAYLDRTLKSRKPIIVYGHKSPYMIVCFLACVKSGRAYCPIDTSVPLSRVEAIANEVEPEVILATEELSIRGKMVLPFHRILSVIQEEREVIPRERHLSAEDVFYIIFTSGSTGTPKGVQITRDCLDNFIAWAVTLGAGFREEEPCTFINQAPFSFDLSVMDLYLALYTGGTLWALEKETQHDMRKLLHSLEKSHGNVWVSTPSFAELCLSDKKFSKELMPGIKTFLFCGEMLANHTAGRLKAAFPDAVVVNTYGPTESTVAVTEIAVSSEVEQKYNPLPVGREKEGTWIFIVDEQGKDLPEGEKGEIVIAGDTVSIGYWNNEELSRKAFGSRMIGSQEWRLYHTGDKGYKKDGLLFYCGRMDLQVKLHGYRIEIEDIESNMMRLPYVEQAAIEPVFREGKAKSLTAYVVAKDGIGKSFEAAQQIRADLRQFLPEYMVPKKIVFLKQLPMTGNGKVDRKALGGQGK